MDNRWKHKWNKDWERLNKYLYEGEINTDFSCFAVNALMYWLTMVQLLDEEINKKEEKIKEFETVIEKALKALQKEPLYWLTMVQLLDEEINKKEEKIQELKALLEKALKYCEKE